MAIKECPHCFNGIDIRASKCPHCHEFIHAETWFEELRNWFDGIILKLCGRKREKLKFPGMSYKIMARILSSFLIAAIIGVAVGWLSSLPESWHLQYSQILGFIAFLIAVIALTRPLNIQTAVIIAFIALIFNGLGILWQKENFDLRNRPFLQILSNNFKIEFTGLYRIHNSNPEPELRFTWPFFNHGPVPANVKDIRIQGNADKNKSETDDAVVIGAYRKDRLEQWESLDVFPSTAGSNSNVYTHRTTFYLNINDVKTLIGVDLDKDSILKDSIQKSKEAPLFLSPYLQAKGTEQLPDFKLIVQFVYHALGETKANKKPYFYWVSYKHNDGVFYPVSSGTEEKIFRKS